MLDVFDMPETYLAQVVPDEFPDHPKMHTDRWSEEERAMYVGGDPALYSN